MLRNGDKRRYGLLMVVLLEACVAPPFEIRVKQTSCDGAHDRVSSRSEHIQDELNGASTPLDHAPINVFHRLKVSNSIKTQGN